MDTELWGPRRSSNLPTPSQNGIIVGRKEKKM